MTTDAFRSETAGLQVDADPVDVEPGASATTRVRVHSSASEPVDVVVDVLGPHASWCSVTPAGLHLEPDEQAEITAHIRTPLDLAGAPGPIVVGVRANAPGTELQPHVGELRVRLLVTVDVDVDLVPSIQRVSGRARLTAVVRNNGHTPMRVELHPGDFAPELDMRIRPAIVKVPARGRARAHVVVRAPTPWTGPEPEHQLTVRAAAGDEQLDALASFVQRTRASTALLVLAGLLVLLAVVLLTLVFRGGEPATIPAIVVMPLTFRSLAVLHDRNRDIVPKPDRIILVRT